MLVFWGLMAIQGNSTDINLSLIQNSPTILCQHLNTGCWDQIKCLPYALTATFLPLFQVSLSVNRRRILDVWSDRRMSIAIFEDLRKDCLSLFMIRGTAGWRHNSHLLGWKRAGEGMASASNANAELRFYLSSSRNQSCTILATRNFR